jgi:hypothetical protein
MAAVIFAVGLGFISAGCTIKEDSGTKLEDAVYEIVEESGLPEELVRLIDEKKASDFKLTYESGESCYIVRGYGEQATGGYSIKINECYLTSNALVIDTELIGPRNGDKTVAKPSYPYIVIKTEIMEKNVVFD